jgi:hypothetical protein
MTVGRRLIVTTVVGTLAATVSKGTDMTRK